MEQFALRHACVTRLLELAGTIEKEKKLPDIDADGKLHVDQLLIPEQVASPRLGGAFQMGDVIERIIARDNLERPVSPSARMLAPPTRQRAVPTGLNAHLPIFRRCVDLSDDNEPERPVSPPSRPQLEYDDGGYKQIERTKPHPVRRRKGARRRANPFIDTEPGVEGDTSNDEGTNDENDNRRLHSS